MKRLDYFLLFILSLMLNLVVAQYQSAPGYMDADYYYAGGLNLVKGYGFTEPFIWNYLDDPIGIPHPGFTYWMPLASILAACGMMITGFHNFTSSRIFFILVASLIPLFTTHLSFVFTGRRKPAYLAGFFAIISGYYFPYLLTTDTFSIYMLLGVLWFIVAIIKPNFSDRTLLGVLRQLQPLWMGLLAGLMHLTRLDGVIWFGLALLIVLLPLFHPEKPLDNKTNKRIIYLEFGRNFLLLLAGYLVIMAPWMIRNLFQTGDFLSTSGWRTLWLTQYDELYNYPASALTSLHWIASGFGEIIRVRGNALWINIQTAFGVQGQVYLAPLVLASLWRLRSQLKIQIFCLAWLIVLIMMTLVFPFAGIRGGFFHAGAAFQPLWWALAPLGLETLLYSEKRLRGWDVDQAFKVFSVGLLVLALLTTSFIVFRRVIGTNFANPIWGKSQTTYTIVEKALRRRGAQSQDVVMVNNPPGYFIASGRPALVIPNGDVSTLLAVARRYHGQYLLLEYNHPKPLDNLYHQTSDLPGLEYLFTLEKIHIFKIVASHE